MDKRLMKSKKGILADMSSLSVAVVSFAMVIVIGLLIMATVKSQVGDQEGFDATNATLCATSIACNGSNTAIEGVSDLTDWIALIVIVVIGGLILALVKRFS